MRVAQSDPGAYLKVFWRWKLLFLLILVGVPVAAYFVVSGQQKVYQSRVLVQEGTLPVDTSLFASGNAPATNASVNNETLAGDARVVETPKVARLAAGFLNRPGLRNPGSPRVRASSLLDSISANADLTTGFITITAHASQPREAARIANAFGSAVVKLRGQEAVGLLTTAIDQIGVQLDQMRPGDIGRAQLSGELQRLRALRAAQGSNAQILQAATPSASPVAPRKGRALALGIVAGLLLGIGAVFLAEALDRRIRHPEELEELTSLPLLSVIPRSALGVRATGRREREAMHMLRSALLFFNVDRSISTVLVASPVKGEGKTTVATGLALAAAEGGRDVVLVDADLRRPQAASRLGVSELEQPGSGLAAVLSGQRPLAEALVDVSIGEPTENGSEESTLRGRLRLLPAGGTPPNPSELLASKRMQNLLSELGQSADLVVIDTNPLLSVSDSLPLFDYASGVIVVARLNSTTKDALRRFHKTIANTSATVLGIVATGAAGGIYGRYGYGYGYGYYGYTSSGNGNGHSEGRLARLRRRAKQPS